MHDILDDVLHIWQSGDVAAVATVVRTFDSAPRRVGASMVVGPDGAVAGSVEGAVYELAQDVLDSGAPVLTRYGISDDDAFAVGLTCGGTLDVFVQQISQHTFPEFEALVADVRGNVPVAMATVVAHTDPERLGRRIVVGESGTRGSLGSARADDAVADDAKGLLAAGRSAVLTYGPDGQRRGEGMEVFVSSHAPPPRMLVFGAIDFAAAVAQQGVFLGYRVTVCGIDRSGDHRPPLGRYR